MQKRATRKPRMSSRRVIGHISAAFSVFRSRIYAREIAHGVAVVIFLFFLPSCFFPLHGIFIAPEERTRARSTTKRNRRILLLQSVLHRRRFSVPTEVVLDREYVVSKYLRISDSALCPGYITRYTILN